MHRVHTPTRQFAFLLQVCLLTLLLLAASTGRAQVAGSSNIQGTVLDASGAVISNALVSLTNESTYVKRTTPADRSGVYVFPNIGIGAYNLVVTAQAGTLNQTC